MEHLTMKTSEGKYVPKYTAALSVKHFYECVERLGQIEDILGPNYDLDRLRDLVEADKAGRCVVLPFPLHRMLLNTSDPYNPELMKDFRISAAKHRKGLYPIDAGGSRSHVGGRNARCRS